MTPLLAPNLRQHRSFERLYQRHVGDVYRYALAVMRNQADAEDVTQTTFLNAYRAFENGQRPEKPQNWLISIAHNVCRQRFRQSARRPAEVAFDDDIGTQLVEPDDDAPTGEDIRRALGHLAFNQRAALVMRELEGRSYAEIAEILDLSPSAVETLIFRARRALREQLESALTCGEAELAISRQLDGRLPRSERGGLRAHLRACPQCATFARRQRAQRAALKSLAAVPVPASLTSLFGGGGAAVTTGLAFKAATALTVGALIGGASYEGVHNVVHHHHAPRLAATPQRTSTAVVARTPSVPSLHAAVTHDVSRAVVGHKKHRATTHLSYHGDASVAARHVHGQPHATQVSHPAQPVHPVHPAHPFVSHRPATPPGQAKPKPAAHVKKSLPGPFDSSAENGPAAGAVHGKGK